MTQHALTMTPKTIELTGPADCSVFELCRSRGISRRRFFEYCAAVTTTLALPPSYAQVVAKALIELHGYIFVVVPFYWWFVMWHVFWC